MSFDLSAMDGKFMTVAEYSNREVIGVSLLIAISCLSIIAVLCLLLLMGVAAWSNRISENKSYFFRTNVAAYFLCLLVVDLMQAVASVMSARWVHLGGVHKGQFCTAQAVLKQASDVGYAIWSFAISAQTFCLLFYQLRSPRWVVWVVLVFASALVVMFTLIGPVAYRNNANGDFYGISGYWCWVTSEYDMARVTLDYMIMFLSSSLSFILYTLVFFRLRGNIVVTGWRARFRMLQKDESGWRGRQRADSRVLCIAKQMILHPIAYTILFLPIAVLRFCEWAGRPVSFHIMMLGDSIFLLAGIVDVVLFCTIRRVIPIREVVKALFTGQVFRTREESPTETTWNVGSLESGKKCTSDGALLPANDGLFVFRQTKFDIINPSPALLPDRIARPMISHQTVRLSFPISTEVVHTNPPSPLPKARSIPRKPVPNESLIYSEEGESHDRTPSSSRQDSIRKPPPVLQGPRTVVLSPGLENRGTPLPHHPTTSQSRRYSVSGSTPSHGHSDSPDPAATRLSIPGSTLLGPTGGNSSETDYSSSKK